jgi:O-antigen/teichoic acid export membrane protein
MGSGQKGSRPQGTFWSFVDQGAVSLGNFLTQIILARNLPPKDYGIFVLLFTAMLLLNNCHLSLVTYPLSIRGAASDLGRLRKITTSSLAFTAAGALPQFLVVFGVALVLKHAGLTLVIALSLVCWQLQETLRRALMAHMRHRAAVPGDALSYGGQAAALWILARHGGQAVHGALSLPVAFQVIAATSLVAAFLQAAQLGLAATGLGETLALARSFWRLGKWNLLTYATDAATTACFPWTLGMVQGPQEAAAFQAASNLLRVSHPVMFGIGNLIVPAAAQAEREGGIRRAGRSAIRSGAEGAMLLIPYFAFLFFWPHGALSLAYGHGSVYAGLATPVRWFVLVYGFMYLFVVLGAFLNGIGRPAKLFAAEAVGTGCALLAGIPLAIRYGLLGACTGFFIVALARFAAASLLTRRLLRSDRMAGASLVPGAER